MTAAWRTSAVAKASTSAPSRTPLAIMSSRAISPVLETATRRPFISAAMRKKFSTGLSMPLLASDRKPSKYSLFSNSNDQLSIESRVTLWRVGQFNKPFFAAAGEGEEKEAVGLGYGRVGLIRK